MKNIVSLSFIAKASALSALTASVIFSISPANAAVITFDDISSSISSGYKSLNWINFDSLDGNSHNPSGYYNGIVSGKYVVLNDGGNPAYFSSSTLFNFNTAYLTAAWNDGLNVTVQGFVGGLSGTKAYEKTLVLNSTSPTKVSFDFFNIDTVYFSPYGGVGHPGYPGGGTHFAMDNVEVEYNATPSAVPEPLTILGAMTAAGFGAGFKRKLAKSQQSQNDTST